LKKIIILFSVLCMSTVLLSGCKKEETGSLSDVSINENQGTDSDEMNNHSNENENESREATQEGNANNGTELQNPEEVDALSKEKPEKLASADNSAGEGGTVVDENLSNESTGIFGSVVSLTDNGFKIFIPISEEEDEEDLVAVIFQEGCFVKSVIVDVKAGTSEFRDEAKESVKIGDFVNIRGNYQGSKEFSASGIIIKN